MLPVGFWFSKQQKEKHRLWGFGRIFKKFMEMCALWKSSARMSFQTNKQTNKKGADIEAQWVKPPLWTSVFHIGEPGVKFHLYFPCSYLLIQLGGSRWWTKYMDSCHHWGRPAWCGLPECTSVGNWSKNPESEPDVDERCTRVCVSNETYYLQCQMIHS